MHNGDLAIVRAASEYRSGEVVAYRNPDIGPVIHRVLAIEEGRFVFQGDNNSWVDSYSAAQSDLIGALWVHVPRIGALMEGARGSGALPILGGLGGVILMVNFLGGSDKSPTTKRRRRVTRPESRTQLGESAQSILAALGMALAGFSILGFLAFSQPTDHSGHKDVGYEQSGKFSYSANVPGAAVYDTDVAGTGDPVFRKLASQVDVDFTYAFTAMSPSDINGTQQLVAIVTDTNGWRRTLPITDLEPFDGTSFSTHAMLDLNRIQATIDSLEVETGIKKDHHEIFVVPEVTTTGTVAGQLFADRFEPRLGFRFDAYQLQMLPPGPKEADPRTPSQSSSVQVPQLEANTISALGAKLTVADARRLALLGITFAVGGGIMFAFFFLKGIGRNESARIAARLGNALVSVRSDGPRTGRIIDVDSIEDLARLAERAGALVLHEVEGNLHQYFVEGEGVTYRVRDLRLAPDQNDRGRARIR